MNKIPYRMQIFTWGSNPSGALDTGLPSNPISAVSAGV